MSSTKVVKKYLSLFIAITVFFASFNIPFIGLGTTVNAAESLLNSYYYTKVPLNTAGGENDLGRLNNNRFDEAVVAQMNKGVDMSTNEYYMDVVFKDGLADVSSLVLGCNPAHHGAMGLTKVGISAYDDSTQKWTEITSYDVTWTESDAKTVIAINNLPSTYWVRIYFQSANRAYDLFRMEELALYGTQSSVKNTNLAANSTVTVANKENTHSVPIGNIGNVTDGDFASPCIVSPLPSVENPYTVSFDFGDVLYNVTSFDMLSEWAEGAAVTDMSVEYKNNSGVWTKIKAVTITRGTGKGTNNFEADIIDFGGIISAKGIRLIITGSRTNDGVCRIGDIILHGKLGAEPEAPKLQGTRLDGTCFVD